MVSGVTYRNPAILAKMAVTVDHISGGRLDFGLGAGWHEEEHRGYGLGFPSAGVRVEMLDEALTIIRRLWTEDSVTFEGRHYRMCDALANPKPLQKPHPPIVIGGEKPKMLRVIARHADEWNVPSYGDVAAWAKTSALLDEACAEVGRDPAGIRRSIQLFIQPAMDGQLEEQGPTAGAGRPRLRPRRAVVLSAAHGGTVAALRANDLADQMVPPAPAPNAPCVTGSSACIGAGPRRDRRIRPSTHVAKCDSAKLTLIIKIAITIRAGT
jgi:alkanesulfonate monooxygenase SsuD/methylene tetrahydromethanopterin reductase-like flavin-dependent oxidoreductase (luciferase family)